MNYLFDMLYSNRHFLNCKFNLFSFINPLLFIVLGDLLSKKPATTRVEKFLAQHVKEKLRELSLDKKIEASFESLSQKI